VFQKINDPKPVIASEAKQSQGLGLLRFALYETLRERNDNWAFFYLEYSKSEVVLANTKRNYELRITNDELF
jgi:predicted metal-dependent hydrolase